jgi:HEAT repeat protein
VRELTSDDPELRYEAALACGAIGDRQAVPHLAPLLEDQDQEVREAAIAALGEIGGEEARELLTPLLDDPSPAIRAAAEEALVELEFAADPLSLRSFLDDR